MDLMKISSVFLLRSLTSLLVILLAAGCEKTPVPTQPPPGGGHAQDQELCLGPAPYPVWPADWPGTAPDSLWSGLSPWEWSWTAVRPDSAGPPATGTALLVMTSPAGGAGSGATYRWTFTPLPPRSGGQDSLILRPARPHTWLAMTCPVPAPGDTAGPLPLPRLPVGSPDYSDLVQFLAQLTRPYFDCRVIHWPQTTIPVRLVPAVSGEVDLAQCLREAMALWNTGRDKPWFEVQETPAWGVRLVHFSGMNLHPPLMARITRLDDEAQPLMVQILVGDTYDVIRDRPYAVRGFIHELGHALFLWGHSRDRNHILWGSAPPIVDAPSLDERKAALLWHSLPEGLDLSNYFSAR